MGEQKFNLSSNREEVYTDKDNLDTGGTFIYREEKIKEFLNRLKGDIALSEVIALIVKKENCSVKARDKIMKAFEKTINVLAGEKLT